MQSTIGLPRLSNFPPLKCNVHKTIKRTLLGLSHGLEGLREKSGQMHLGNVEVLIQVTREQLIKTPKTMKLTNTPNLKVQ